MWQCPCVACMFLICFYMYTCSIVRHAACFSWMLIKDCLEIGNVMPNSICCVLQYVERRYHATVCLKSTARLLKTSEAFVCVVHSCAISSHLTYIVFTWVLGTLGYFNKGTQAPEDAYCSAQYCFSVSQYCFVMLYVPMFHVCCIPGCFIIFLAQFCKAAVQLVFDMSVALEVHIPSR